MSPENIHSKGAELSFEEKITAIGQEWEEINYIINVDQTDRPTDAEQGKVKNILERLASKGVTPENHEVAAALKKISDCEDEIYKLENQTTKTGEDEPDVDISAEEDAAIDLNEAKENLKELVEKYHTLVLGAY